ncbi:UDP-glucose/GDP-mannose dehydrogenase family protein [Brevibacillus nitrificans]|uniref:UDP-glucose dehydrogenase family protein n=1 Tax=Brevibacillus nitrificans TaxID=651560 RepID=UPI002861AA30|nr:UDP-glucose/GDP-mannose dehydrogenase family protein [Brevibacillus nitrificans]MDR7313917.1 UDPglucose 6-dehydrogenase [Brevibacillus nitrificans]
MKVAVIGTGYVGLTTAVSLAMHGHEVLGIDLVAAKIAQLRQGKSPIYEPGLEVALTRTLEQGNLQFSTEIKDASEAEMMFICVGTPEASDGSADMSYLLAAVSDVASLQQPSSRKRVIVIKSTVPVGTGDRIAEQLRGIDGLYVVSNPEFLREGSAMQDALKPSRIVIGADHEAAFAAMEQLYKGVNAAKVTTTRANAEFIKYASNTFLATKISFMNELARLSTVLGTDITTVAQGMGLDSRIGPEFLRAGVGYGGSCFPKDTTALLQLAGQHGISLSILDKVRDVNTTQPAWFLERLEEKLHGVAGKKIAVLGLAFKPDTDDIREAPSLKVLEDLQKKGASIAAYDPIASAIVGAQFPNVQYVKHPAAAFKGAHAAMLITEWKECVQLDWNEIKASMATPILFDGRNAWPSNLLKEAGFAYTGVGRS